MKLIGNKKPLIAGAVLVAIVFVGGAFMPQWRRLYNLRATAESMRGRVDQNGIRMQAAKESYQKVLAARRKSAVLDAAIPNKPNLGAFLESVSRVADKLKLSDRDMIPSKEVRCRQVVVLPIEMSFRGTFDAVHAFLAQLESMPRIARVQRLDLDASPDHPGELNTSITVFVYNRNT